MIIILLKQYLFIIIAPVFTTFSLCFAVFAYISNASQACMTHYVKHVKMLVGYVDKNTGGKVSDIDTLPLALSKFYFVCEL